MQPDEQATKSTVVSVKCPNCGGPLAYKIENSNWNCQFCLSAFTEEDIDKAEMQSGTEENQPQSDEKAAETNMRQYTCPSCGGRVITDENTTATFCTYCHNPAIISSKLEGEYKPNFLIPFKQTKQQATAALQKLCKRRLLLPRSFKEVAQKGEVSGLYVPYWLFGGKYKAGIDASATKVSHWSDSNYRYTKTDTYHVERHADICIENVPADGSKRMDDAIMEGIEPYEYSEMVPFALQYLSGHVAENYDVSEDICEERYKQRAYAGMESELKNTVIGYTAVNVTQFTHQDTQSETQYALLPVWTVMVPYRDKTYSFTMNGQTGKIVGKLPVAWGKAAALFGAATALGALVSWFAGVFV
jgi:predicted RNA-binding Zn-ribbon protein involved in translation (DUF1610 family)